MLLDDGFINKDTWENRSYIFKKKIISKKVPAILVILEFPNTAEGLLFLFYNHRMRKVAQVVFVVLHSGDKYEHLTKLWGKSYPELK